MINILCQQGLIKYTLGGIVVDKAYHSSPPLIWNNPGNNNTTLHPEKELK